MYNIYRIEKYNGKVSNTIVVLFMRQNSQIIHPNDSYYIHVFYGRADSISK